MELFQAHELRPQTLGGRFPAQQTVIDKSKLFLEP